MNESWILVRVPVFNFYTLSGSRWYILSFGVWCLVFGTLQLEKIRIAEKPGTSFVLSSACTRTVSEKSRCVESRNERIQHPVVPQVYRNQPDLERSRKGRVGDDLVWGQRRGHPGTTRPAFRIPNQSRNNCRQGQRVVSSCQNLDRDAPPVAKDQRSEYLKNQFGDKASEKAERFILIQ